ncbi:hypothetical protein DFP93_102389 [Aneurinibacillus soli]|uniref:Uncharacterized protein n=1 Tax=Aneurinibacillus soli TaxID=1500254 RepID=A0A0U5BAX5_9BACL|nr:hypothetical protein [Aneurinibacillus soli]PYE63700.1 hypothetical protein DFP93_102389 [Aneurinibacillus soli]BAU27367.1 hypothetical protein CB4_01541 [Aneurinibacillus soli]
MKSQDGFSYVETVISILLVALLVGVTGQMTALAVQIRQKQAEETQGYLLAYSMVERWKMDGVVGTFQKEVEGCRYYVGVQSGPLTERVEQCEVLVQWGESEAERKQVQVKGSRFLGRAPVRGAGSGG